MVLTNDMALLTFVCFFLFAVNLGELALLLLAAFGLGLA